MDLSKSIKKETKKATGTIKKVVLKPCASREGVQQDPGVCLRNQQGWARSWAYLGDLGHPGQQLSPTGETLGWFGSAQPWPQLTIPARRHVDPAHHGVTACCESLRHPVPPLPDTAGGSALQWSTNEFLMPFNHRNSHECFMTCPAGSGSPSEQHQVCCGTNPPCAGQLLWKWGGLGWFGLFFSKPPVSIRVQARKAANIPQITPWLSA